MSLMTVISTGDFQMPWNVLSLSISERESGKWPLGLSDLCHTTLSVMSVFSTLEGYHLQHLIKTIFSTTTWLSLSGFD